MAITPIALQDLQQGRAIVDKEGLPTHELLRVLNGNVVNLRSILAEQATQLGLIEAAQADIIDALELAGIAVDAAAAAQTTANSAAAAAAAAQADADAVILANAIGDSYTAPSAVLSAVDAAQAAVVTNSVNTTVTGLGDGVYRIEKTGGVDGVVDASAVSPATIAGNFLAKFTVLQNNKGIGGGFSTNPTASAGSVDLIPFFGGDGNLRIFEAGVLVYGPVAYAANAVIWMRRTSGTLEYISGGATPGAGTVVRTVANSSTLGFDAAVEGSAGKIDVGISTTGLTGTTVTVDGHTRFYGDGTSLAVTGTAFTGKGFGDTLAVYYDDATRADTTPAYVITADLIIAQNNYAPGRHLVGTVMTPESNAAAETGGTSPPGSGYSPGSGGYELPIP